ncbi:MAG: NAD-dependent epimerase/dehydratase family protein [Chloroflexi bacterium]|nr:NAD-dependent epimerase/dehydratase family protein [Chloroflexota bacterium]
MRAFVTGATGFVGSAVVRSLLRRGVAVKALARRSSDLRNIAGLDVEVFYGDLFDEEGLACALRGCDVLYHIAAYYSTDEADAPMMYEVNVRGTKTVMRAALKAGVPRAVHTSTIGTIGQPMDGSLATEEAPFNLWDTGSHYVKSKYLGEIAALAMNEQGLSVVVVNPCAPVGPRDIKPSSTGQRIVDYLNGRLPSFVSGGINFISVHDVAEGEVLAAERGRAGERYILGHREGNLSLSDFLTLMEEVSGVRAPRMPRSWPSLWPIRRGKPAEEAPSFRPKALTCDPSKAICELGLPQTPLAVAFAEAVAWFRENGYVRM